MKKLITLTDYNKGALLAIAGIFLFSAKAVLVKVAYQNYDIDPVSLLLLRMIFSLPVYLVVIYFKRKTLGRIDATKTDYLSMVFLGIVGYYLASFFDFEGLKFITASLERLILFIYPTLVLLISAIVFKNKIGINQWKAILITYLGILITFSSSFGQEQQNGIFYGSFWIFMSAFTYAMYIVGSGRLIPKFGSVLFTAFAMTVSCICVIVHQIIANGWSWHEYPFGIYIIGFCMAMFSTILPSFLVSEAIKKIGSSNFAVFGSLGPIFTILLAVIFIGEVLDIFQIAGTIIVIVGVLSLNVKKSRLRNYVMVWRKRG